MHFIYDEPIQGCTKHLEYRLVIDSKWYNLTSQRVHLEDPCLEGKDILENTIIQRSLEIVLASKGSVIATSQRTSESLVAKIPSSEELHGVSKNADIKPKQVDDG